MSYFGGGMEIMTLILIVKMKWKTMMKQMCFMWKTKLCRILHSFGMFTLMTFRAAGFGWASGSLMFDREAFLLWSCFDREGSLSVASLVTSVSVKHFSCHNCFCETYLRSMYFKYAVSEKLCILPLFKTRCIGPLKLPGGSCCDVPK